MTALDIEKLFIDELGLYEVAVWEYDKTTKKLDMRIEIDFREEFLSIPKTKFCTATVDFFDMEYYMFVFNNTYRKNIDTRVINIKNNNIIMEINTKEDIQLLEYIKKFFSDFLKTKKIL